MTCTLCQLPLGGKAGFLWATLAAWIQRLPTVCQLLWPTVKYFSLVHSDDISYYFLLQYNSQCTGINYHIYFTYTGNLVVVFNSWFVIHHKVALLWNFCYWGQYYHRIVSLVSLWFLPFISVPFGGIQVNLIVNIHGSSRVIPNDSWWSSDFSPSYTSRPSFPLM